MEKRAKLIAPPETGILFRQGDQRDAVYFVKTGKITLAMEAGENSIMTLRVPAGSLLGLPAVMGNKPYSLTATAVGQVEVFRISCDDFIMRLALVEVRRARGARADRCGRDAMTARDLAQTLSLAAIGEDSFPIDDERPAPDVPSFEAGANPLDDQVAFEFWDRGDDDDDGTAQRAVS